MGGKKSRNGEEPKPNQILRRSPRFLHRSQAIVVYSSTGRRTGDSDLSSTPRRASIAKGKKDGGKTSKRLKKCRSGSRRSARSDGREDVDDPDFQILPVVEKRVTRSSARGVRPKISREGGRRSTLLSNSAKSVEASKRLGETELVVEKRVTRSSVRGNKFGSNLIGELDSADKARVSSKGANSKGGSDSCKQTRGVSIEIRINQSDAEENGIQGAIVDPNFKRKARIGEKRKRCEVDDKCGNAQGWNVEQELALQRAYFSAKPTPRFWKKVARMVPGKSAEECFDRIHADQSTPSQPQTRSRAKKKNPSSPLSFSASKLLSSAKTKKNQSNRRKTLMAQKTVRHLLQKQQTEDQNHEADFFAILEPAATNSPLPNFQNSALFASPPPPNRGSLGVNSSSSLKKHRSRLKTSETVPFVSPPVLKQIKNKSLHEKYIDQLHTRDARRKANALRNGKIVPKRSPLEVKSVKFAKDALVFDALDAIDKFRALRMSTNDEMDIDDDGSYLNDDEDEDELR